MRVNYSILGWVGASNNDPGQGSTHLNLALYIPRRTYGMYKLLVAVIHLITNWVRFSRLHLHLVFNRYARYYDMRYDTICYFNVEFHKVA